MITNSKGHNNTPHVSENDRFDSPNNVKLAGVIPSTLSKENIFPPIHSAINALATKKATINVKTFVGRSLRIFLVINELFYVAM